VRGTAEPGWETPPVIVCVVPVDDEERTLVLRVLLEEVLAWVRSLPGAFGVGLLLATQNPIWAIERLQTDADRKRLVDGLSGTAGKRDKELEAVISKLAPRWFVLRNVHAEGAPILLNPRHTMSYLKGPLTRVELKQALPKVQELKWAAVEQLAAVISEVSRVLES
jgi:hypothetical protein